MAIPKKTSVRPGAFALLLLAAIAACSATKVEDRNTLQTLVQTQCVPNQLRTGNPAPCVEVNPAGGYAVLKDRRGQTQFLLVPTPRVRGIEDPFLLDAAAPDYFAAAWMSRHYVEEALGKPLPREDVAIAVNSAHGRSQDQLHLHIDCVRPEVRNALADDSTLTTSWTEFPTSLAGHAYRARIVLSDTLDGIEPFVLLANEIPDAKADMGSYTLAVIGHSFQGRPGFILLVDHADDAHGDHASSAALLDHSCAVTQ